MKDNVLIAENTAENTHNISLYSFVKRFFDILFSLTALVILSPVLIVVSILIRLDSKGKAIFVQKRIGLNGKLFNMYKFRSMYQNADAILEEMIANDPAVADEYAINKKLKNDPRITRVGKFIRKTSIDELPQLFNVLTGDMSLIGNRPYLPKEMNDMGGYLHEIVKTKPGITGYWQVSGRNDTSFIHRCKLEATYSHKACFKLDLKIFFKTFKVLFKGL